MPYPEGHAWGIALTVEPAADELMWRLVDKPYVTFPDDLRFFPDYGQQGLVFAALDRYCVKCRQKFDLCAWGECLADTTNGEHLRGGNSAERKSRSTPHAPLDVLVRRAASPVRRQRREVPAYMQASRLDGLN
ncbi:hypothetical protein [Planomonospora sp. ID82291]|uniref:hypothetical protein n=1 Tax=Planomonospora sp. ID82291 TaxID=2738136 RepID=UPI0018C38E4C|nr:hypothetical protein [Planomonospora sp. ID82291]MBG0818969.1 hypothetical protein [Planomonospora sp. ID82291]